MQDYVSVGIFLHKLGNFLPNLHLTKKSGFGLKRLLNATGERASMQESGKLTVRFPYV